MCGNAPTCTRCCVRVHLHVLVWKIACFVGGAWEGMGEITHCLCATYVPWHQPVTHMRERQRLPPWPVLFPCEIISRRVYLR